MPERSDISRITEIWIFALQSALVCAKTEFLACRPVAELFTIRLQNVNLPKLRKNLGL